MNTRMIRQMATGLLGGLLAVGALTSCSGGGPTLPEPNLPTALPGAEEVAEVTDEALGEALVFLMVQGQPRYLPEDAVDERCLVNAARGSSLSAETLSAIVSTNSDDIAALAKDLMTSNPADAATLLSPALLGELESCINWAVLGTAEVEPATADRYVPPGEVAALSQAEPVLTPTFTVKENEQMNSAAQYTEGLVVTLSSYAHDEAESSLYVSAGSCLSGVVSKAGFTQETLRWIAGGVPVGAGALADQLPQAADQDLWRSEAFERSMAACLDAAAMASPSPQATEG